MEHCLVTIHTQLCFHLGLRSKGRTFVWSTVFSVASPLEIHQSEVEGRGRLKSTGRATVTAEVSLVFPFHPVENNPIFSDGLHAAQAQVLCPQLASCQLYRTKSCYMYFFQKSTSEECLSMSPLRIQILHFCIAVSLKHLQTFSTSL